MDGCTISAEIPETEAATPTIAGEAPLSHMRLWFLIFVTWAMALTLIAHLSIAQYEAGNTAAAGAWILALMCFYLSLCNTMCPLPTMWIVMLAATDSVADYAPPWQRVLLTAACGAVATAMANLNEYHVLSHRSGARLRQRLRDTRTYQWAVRWFNSAPFAALTLVAFVPIPIDVVRWLAILRRYSRHRFAAAYVLGRGVRYLLFAGVAVAAGLNWWQILLVQVGIIVAGLLGRFAWTGLRARTA
ncbi:MAG: hypothetical protein JXO22_03990 [Phycisphaerae bacterium]|nr:hypothetical protein [Phycisphaerae bacterium]